MVSYSTGSISEMDPFALAAPERREAPVYQERKPETGAVMAGKVSIKTP